MPLALSRRQFLAATAGAYASVGTPRPDQAQAATAAAYLIVGQRNIEVNGKPASVFGIGGADASSGLVVEPNRNFQVVLENQSGEPTIVHWHGQTPPADQDGVTDTGVAALISPGQTQPYNFTPREGTHWMHSHHGLQEQRLLAAPLIVHSKEDLAEDVQQVTVLLHDFTFRDPAEVFAQLTHGAAMQHGGMAMPHQMGGGVQSGQVMAGMEHDLNDVDYDAYLANDRTLADPQVFRTERNGRVRLRLINGASATGFWLDVGAASATVIAVDGDPVEPLVVNRFPLAQGQRCDLLVSVPAGGVLPVLAQREGDVRRTGFILAGPGAHIDRIADHADMPTRPLDLSIEQRLIAKAPLAGSGKPEITKRITLTGSMMPYVWGIDGRNWSNHSPVYVQQGRRVILEIMNQSAMAHPMHLHGHHFQVIAINGTRLRGAMRDTVLVPIEGAVTVAFDADNPGRWLLHCHNLYHMAVGMMTEVVYGDST
jgi:FtsP/CotA-like multicopper oxidase with cupredoxin domain